MKKILVIFYAVLFFYQTAASQTITSKNGLTTIVFDTKYAIVTVSLPDDLQNGDKISGTFSVITAGLTEEQLQKSLLEVRKYRFNFSNPENQTSILQRMVNINPYQLVSLLPLKITSSLILTLTESTGKEYKAEIKPSGDPDVTVDGCLTPQHIMLGKSLRVTGTFDGNASNTRVTTVSGNTYFQVLAESPRQSIVQIPDNLKITDNMELQVSEDFKPKCTQPVIPVKMIVGAEVIAVKKGQTATVYLTIKGLEGMEGVSHLTVENKTPAIISLKDGNKQELEITSAMFKGGKDFKMNFTVQGITSGEFSLDFNLDIPEDFPDVIER